MLLRDMNLVIVESGPKAQKKFRRLMLNRIKWSEDSKKHADSDDEGDKTTQNFCRLVWEVSIVFFLQKLSQSRDLEKNLAFKNLDCQFVGWSLSRLGC